MYENESRRHQRWTRELYIHMRVPYIVITKTGKTGCKDGSIYMIVDQSSTYLYT